MHLAYFSLKVTLKYKDNICINCSSNIFLIRKFHIYIYPTLIYQADLKSILSNIFNSKYKIYFVPITMYLK